MYYPNSRPRRNRASEAIRNMVQENHVRLEQLIAPLFIMEGSGSREEIPSMSDYYGYTLDEQVKQVKQLYQLGIRSVLLFVKCRTPRRLF